jgi:hypothetical protein
MAPAPEHTRRWYQFGLRSLFMAMTLAAVPLGWIAYSLNWIHQRRAVFDQLQVRAMSLRDESTEAPAGLWLFGESGVQEIWCRNLTPRDVELVERLFPEAEIVEFRGGSKERPPWW